MTKPDDMLQSSDYFDCQELKCRLRLDVCIERQERNNEERSLVSRFRRYYSYACEGCRQGEENRLIAEKRKSMKGDLIEAPGDKMKKDEALLLCTECREKPRLSKNCPLCPSCMAKMPRKKNINKAKS